jgi:hypothetical protein
MVNDNITKAPLQIMYLSISLLSSFCVFNNCYLLPCCNIIAVMCLIDFYFVKNKDMIFHHILSLCMIHHININNNEYINELISIVLKTEISTIFLTINNLLNCITTRPYLKNINKILFLLTFIYYRIYNYFYYLILNKNSNYILFIYSKNNFDICKVYISIYGLFILNLYWYYLILNILFQSWKKSIKSSNETKNME